MTFGVDGVATAYVEPESGEDYLFFCNGFAAQVGADGTIYTTSYVVHGGGHGATDVHLVANDGEDRLWTSDVIEADCSLHSNKKGSVNQMVLGADGNIYVAVAPYQTWGCPAGLLLMGFDGSDGTKLFEEAPGSNSFTIAAYEDGLVTVNAWSEISFFSYAGVEVESYNIGNTSSLNGVFDGFLSVSHDGTAFVALRQSRQYTSQCPTTSEATGVTAYTVDGLEFDYAYPVSRALGPNAFCDSASVNVLPERDEVLGVVHPYVGLLDAQF